MNILWPLAFKIKYSGDLITRPDFGERYHGDPNGHLIQRSKPADVGKKIVREMVRLSRTKLKKLFVFQNSSNVISG